MSARIRCAIASRRSCSRRAGPRGGQSIMWTSRAARRSSCGTLRPARRSLVYEPCKCVLDADRESRADGRECARASTISSHHAQCRAARCPHGHATIYDARIFLLSNSAQPLACSCRAARVRTQAHRWSSAWKRLYIPPSERKTHTHDHAHDTRHTSFTHDSCCHINMAPSVDYDRM